MRFSWYALYLTLYDKILMIDQQDANSVDFIVILQAINVQFFESHMINWQLNQSITLYMMQKTISPVIIFSQSQFNIATLLKLAVFNLYHILIL